VNITFLKNKQGAYLSGRALSWHSEVPRFNFQHCKNESKKERKKERKEGRKEKGRKGRKIRRKEEKKERKREVAINTPHNFLFYQ
jgi:hypothetical protein